jgi:hypothetical protein
MEKFIFLLDPPYINRIIIALPALRAAMRVEKFFSWRFISGGAVGGICSTLGGGDAA